MFIHALLVYFMVCHVALVLLLIRTLTELSLKAIFGASSFRLLTSGLERIHSFFTQLFPKFSSFHVTWNDGHSWPKAEKNLFPEAIPCSELDFNAQLHSLKRANNRRGAKYREYGNKGLTVEKAFPSKVVKTCS